MSIKEIRCNDKTLLLEEPVLYVDNQARRRSGHMSHAMAKFAENSIIDFNSNSSAVRHAGHSAFGWIEYRISNDSGKTFSKTYDLEYSKQSMLDGVYCISVEKAVGCDDGSIIAFCLRNSVYGDSVGCMPWPSPTYIKSTDGGKTWSQPHKFCDYPGRIYDALYHNGDIYVLMFCNDDFLGKKEDDLFRLFKSTDNGESFFELSIVPIDTIGRSYCNMIFDTDDVLHFYSYNINAEDKMDHAVSRDNGQNWEVCEPCFVAKGVRNPQIGYLDGVYILHARAGQVKGFVLYTSEDGVRFDEGTMLIEKPNAYCFYSNNIVLEDEKGKFMLIQYSDTYDNCCRVNVWHQIIRIK